MASDKVFIFYFIAHLSEAINKLIKHCVSFLELSNDTSAKK